MVEYIFREKGNNNGLFVSSTLGSFRDPATLDEKYKYAVRWEEKIINEIKEWCTDNLHHSWTLDEVYHYYNNDIWLYLESLDDLFLCKLRW